MKLQRPRSRWLFVAFALVALIAALAAVALPRGTRFDTSGWHDERLIAKGVRLETAGDLVR